jgi:Ca-activated chloride channel family protein
MMTAIRAALDSSDSQKHIRIVCFMTDGYVGNDMEIIAEVQKHQNARVFAFGIGSSVNRFLLDKMAQYGRGEVEYVGLNDDGSAAARRFHERVRNPLLTDIGIDWGGLSVTDLYPKRIPDLFGAKPVIIHGRYTAPGTGIVRLRGRTGGREFSRELRVTLPASEPQHDVLASLWARTRIDDLMGQDYNGIQSGNMRTDLRDAITQLGLDYRLMTQFTSFVAVEEMTITDGGQPHRVEVPVEMPEGVSYEGVFGKDKAEMASGGFVARGRARSFNAPMASPAAPPPQPARPAMTMAQLPESMSGAADARQLSPKEQERLRLASKLHPAITAVIARMKNGDVPLTAQEARFIKDGKATIQIWLTDTSAQNLAQLKQLGFEVVLQPKTAKMIIGRIPIAKLAALADLAFVRYVSPQM